MFDIKLTYLKMSIAKIAKFLLATETKLYTKLSLSWLGLGLFFTVIYALLALRLAFQSEYVFQDDARQHVFWMSRFIDPELFHNDLIADYYESISPWGVKTLYHGMAMLGIEPQLLHKLLPGILALVVTVFSFAVSLEILPIPFGAFVTTLLFSQNVWAEQGTISGTAKDFVYPLFFIFLYFWLKRSLLGVCLALFLGSIFYPPMILIFAGALFWQLWQFKGFIPRLVQDRQIYLFSCISLAVAFILLLPYVLASSAYGPTVTLEQARNIPQFMAGGRTAFFNDNFWEYWIGSMRSGITLHEALVPSLAIAGLFLPLLYKFPQRFALLKKISPKISYLKDLLIPSFGWFFLAHAVLFKLYLPNRYVARSLRVAIIIAAGITLMVLLEAVLSWGNQPTSQVKSIAAQFATALLIILLVGYPLSQDKFLDTDYMIGSYPELYEFIKEQPKDTLIASLSDEADNIASFTNRSVLSSREHAIPYHMGYFQPLRERIFDLIEAQYSPDLALAKDFLKRYGVDLWLIENSSFNVPYLADNRWLTDQQPVTQEAIKQLEQGTIPAIALLQNTCTVFQDDRYTVLESACILKEPNR
ncbi:MAG: hypothetical protein HC939_14120 [Pleurocapsa sp. SU_5_0]|nr:hypothetical protein [Pleurocapsa sp. SU_5_0]